MEEQVIIKGEKINAKSFCIALSIIGVIICILVISNIYPQLDDWHKEAGYFWTSLVPYYGCFTFLPFFIISLIFYWCMSKVEIVVTNKRIYGTAIFGKRVELPLDMVSAVETQLFKGIGISTSSGVIKFLMIKNANEMREKISELLVERQGKNNKANIQSTNNSSADEIKKYKELLDDGAITQEEYERKKKEILDRI